MSPGCVHGHYYYMAIYPCDLHCAQVGIHPCKYTHTHKDTDVKVFKMIMCASHCLKQEVPTGAVRRGNYIAAGLRVVVDHPGVTGAECGGVRGWSHNT